MGIRDPGNHAHGFTWGGIVRGGSGAVQGRVVIRTSPVLTGEADDVAAWVRLFPGPS